MIFNFTIHGDRLQTNTASWGHTGNVNSYLCVFHFDAEWDGLSKFAAIKTEAGYVGPIPIFDNQCIIPYDVLQLPGMFSLGVYGTTGSANDFKRISTNWLPFKINDGAYSEGTAPEVPEPDLWEQYLAQVNSIVQDALEEIEQKVSNLYKFRGYVDELPDFGVEANETYVMLEPSTKTFTADVSDLAGGSISLYRAVSSNGGFLMSDENARKHLPKEFVMQISNGTTTKSIPVQYGVSPSAGTSTMLYWFAESDDVKSVFELYGGHSAASSITIPWTDITITYTLACEQSDIVTWTGFYWDDGGNIFSLDGYITEEDCQEMIDQLAQQTDKLLQDKADKATTLEGYGITEKYYPADQIDKMLSGYYHNKGSVSVLPTTGMENGDTYNMLTSGEKTYSLDKAAIANSFTFTKVPSSDIALVSFADADKAHLPEAFTMTIVMSGQTVSIPIEYGQPPNVQSGQTSYWCMANSINFGSLQSVICYPQSIESITYLLEWDKGDNISWNGYVWDNLGGHIPLENHYTRQESDNKFLPKRTVTGYPVSVSDQLEGVPLLGCTIYGAAGGVGDLVESGANYGKYRIGVKAVGKNLFDKNNCQYIAGYFTQASAALISNANTRTIYVPCSPNTTYTLQRGTEYSQFHFGCTAELPQVDEPILRAITNNTAESLTITTPENAHYLTVYMFNAAAHPTEAWQEILDSLQIVVGATAGPYEPYIENTVEIFLNAPLGEGQAFVCTEMPIAPESSAMNVFTDTAVQPSTIDVKYYQDINKVIAVLQAATIALGGM